MNGSTNDSLSRYMATGDAEAFRELVQTHQDMVYAACHRVLRNAADAEDAAQVCFITLARKPEQIRGSVAGWLHRTATNSAIDLVRQERARKAREVRAMEQKTPASSSSWEDLSAAVDEAINQLPEELRIPIIRYYLERADQKEIARELGVTHSAISKRLQKGVDELRGRLTKGGVTLTGAILATLLWQNAAEAAPAALAAALGKLALIGTGKAAAVGTATAGAKLISEGIAMKAVIATAVVVVLAVGGVATRNLLAERPVEGVAPDNGAPTLEIVADNSAPVIVSTTPAAGATDVDPLLPEISITFNKPMSQNSWSWITRSRQGAFPGQPNATPRWTNAGRTCVLPAVLKPGVTYAVGANQSPEFMNFKSKEGVPAVPYFWTFSTRAAVADIENKAPIATQNVNNPRMVVRIWLDSVAKGDDQKAQEVSRPGEFTEESFRMAREQFDLGKLIIEKAWSDGQDACVITGFEEMKSYSATVALGFGLRVIEGKWLVRDIDLLPQEQARDEFVQKFLAARPNAVSVDEPATPEELARLFVEAMSSGDVDAAMRLYPSREEVLATFASPAAEQMYDQELPRFRPLLEALALQLKGAEFVRWNPRHSGAPVAIEAGKTLGPFTLKANVRILDNTYVVIRLDGVERDLKLDEMIAFGDVWRLSERPELAASAPPPVTLPAIMSEGIAGVGTIRTAVRVYAAAHNAQYPVLNTDGNGLQALGLNPEDLRGRHFRPEDYDVQSNANGYTVTARYGENTYTINQGGVESGTFRTGR